MADNRSALPPRGAGNQNYFVGVDHDLSLPDFISLATAKQDSSDDAMASCLIAQAQTTSHQELIFFSTSRILGFSDWMRPSMATFSAGYSRRKISVSPM